MNTNKPVQFAQLEINREVVFSTAHITEKDSVQLHNDEDGTGLITTYDFEYGYRIYLDKDAYNTIQECVEYSKAFKNLYKIALRYDCKWMVLDCDCKALDNLPTFNW